MKKSLTNSIASDERGIISITVTVIFVMVISLIVLGFSQVSQRNGKLALDRQLSAQANYAAEVGLNDAMKKISEYIDSGYSSVSGEGKLFPPQDECEGEYTQNGGRVYGSDDTVRYTCLLVSEPPDLVATPGTDTSVVWPLNAAPGKTLVTTEVSWRRAANTNGLSVSNCEDVGHHVSPAVWAANCPFALVRVDFIAADKVANAKEAAKATMTMFLYPRSGGTSEYAYSSVVNPYGTGAPQAITGYASCNESECVTEITGLDTIPSAYIRIKPFYQPFSVVRAESTGSELVGGQVQIDVTGKAQDVLRRIQGRVSISGSSSKEASKYFSDYSVESSESVCKRFNVSGRLGNSATGIPSGSGC